MSPPTLRVALVVERSRLDAWQARVVDGLDAVGAEVVTVVHVDRPRASEPHVAGSRLVGALRGRIAEVLEGAGRSIDLAGRTSCAAPGTNTDAPLDVVLDLRPAARAASDLEARFGRWTFTFGGDAGLTALDAFTNAALGGTDSVEVRFDRDGDPLRRGVFVLAPYVLRTGVGAAVDAFTRWPASCAEAFGEGRAALAPFGADPSELPAAVTRPRRGAVAGLAVRAVRALARKALWAEVWTVGLADSQPGAIVAAGLPEHLRWLPERGPRGVSALWRHRGFAADPFLYRNGSEERCLFEALDYETDRGWIAEVDLAEPAASARTVFRNDWHWSYPYILEHDGTTYCIPETADVGEATLHRLTVHGFEPVASLLPGHAVLDPSLVLHGGRWWLFCTLREGSLLNTALHLFVSDELTGPYRPHPDNPVKLDVGSACPAGTVFRVGDTLYRPGQDCRSDYGAALVLHRIDELSWDRFRETPVLTLRPSEPYPAGLHTLSVGHGRVAIDAKRYAFSPPLLASRVARGLRRLCA